MTDRDVRVVAFDVNETMFSLGSLGPVFATVGLDPAVVPLWFAGLLRDGFALTAMGQYRPFAEVAAQQLRALAPDTVDDRAVEAVLRAFRQLDPHPDVEPALRMLHDGGVAAVTLTNGGADLVNALMDRAGLNGLVRRSLSVDAIRRWKPAPEPYLWAAREMDVEPGQVALVASHPWDCAGAVNAGLVSCWVNRTHARWPAIYRPPNVTGPDIPTVVARVAALAG